MEQLIVGWLYGANGYDLLFWSVIAFGLGFSLINEIKRVYKMSKYEELKSSFYNGCGHIFLFVVLIESLSFLVGTGGNDLPLSEFPVASALLNIAVSIAHILSFIGSINIADRLNKLIKPI